VAIRPEMFLWKKEISCELVVDDDYTIAEGSCLPDVELICTFGRW
jgi:hypothetical protein